MAPGMGGVSREVFSNIRDEFGDDLCRGNQFKLECAVGDERIERLATILAKNGIEIPKDKSNATPEVSITCSRTFSPKDLEACEFFQIFPAEPIAEASKEIGRFPIALSQSDLLSSQNDTGFVTPYWWVVACRQNLMNSLVSMNFQGLELVPFGANGDLWLLWSSKVMKEILNRLIDNDGNEISFENGNVRELNGCMPLDGNFGTPVLRFSGAPPIGCDALITKERFSPSKGMPAQASLIVSRRFREYLSGINGTEFFPVEFPEFETKDP